MTAVVLTAPAAAALAHPVSSHMQRPDPDPSGNSAAFPDARSGVEEVGFSPLLNAGFNTDVWAHATQDGRLFAYSGTWGTLESYADPGESCPSQTDNPLDPQQSGVKVVDATDPANPQIAAKIASEPGAQNNDVKVARMTTTDGDRDILAHSLEPCGAEGLLLQLLGPGFTGVPLAQTGFQLYDVSDPANPERLGRFNNGGLGTHNLYLFERPDLGKSYLAAVFNDTNVLGDDDTFVRGELQVFDITDPAAPIKVSDFELADLAGDNCDSRGVDSAMCYLHDVWMSDDGKTAYLSYWDAGLFLVDLTDPEDPELIGRGQKQVDLPADAGKPEEERGWLDEEGNTHAAVPYEIGGKTFAIVTDEDFTGGPSDALQVNSPAAVETEIQPAVWTGTSVGFEDQTSDLVYAGTGCTAASVAAEAGTDLDGKIAIIDDRTSRTNPADTCSPYTYAQKVQAVEQNGAIGLVQVSADETKTAGSALAGDIPAMEVTKSEGDPIADEVTDGDADAVNVTLGKGFVDPWGFLRMVDVTSPDDDDWRQVSTFKAPFVETVEQPAQSTFTAHNPIPGPDGRIYTAWYTDGLRILEPDGTDGKLRESGYFVPLPSDHEGDLDQDPHGAQEDNVGFWGSYAICHPQTKDLLVFNSDLNRGMYVLKPEKSSNVTDGADACGKQAAEPAAAPVQSSGTDGNDCPLRGTAGDDTLDGGLGDDCLEGLAGADTMSGGSGNDSVSGGEGVDTASGGPGNDRLNGGDERDFLTGDQGADRIAGEGGSNVIDGGEGDDTITGGALVDSLNGGADEDTIRGGRGNDGITGASGRDRLYGEAGDDRIEGGLGRDYISGGPGGDNIVSIDGQADTVRCGGGADVVRADGGDDVSSDCERVIERPGSFERTTSGGGRDDSDRAAKAGIGGARISGNGRSGSDLRGTERGDTIDSPIVGDRLFGLDGDDVLAGGSGDDRGEGGGGFDLVSGGPGADTLLGDAARDLLGGGPGADTLIGGADSNIVNGSQANDRLTGGPNSDSLNGGSDEDTIKGGGGDDGITGASGRDKLYGEAGDDRIEGGLGRDFISGGAGGDNIVAADGQRDRIDCGAGSDVVRADDGDRIDRDCELVIERRGDRYVVVSR